MNAQGYYNEIEEENTPAPVTMTAPALALNPQLAQIINTPLPAFRANIRRQTHKEWAQAVRKLFKDMNLTGISVTTPNYSQASTISINLPALTVDDRVHQKLHDTLVFDHGYDCPACNQRQTARKHCETIILAAFPDLNDRGIMQEDYFNHCLSFD